MADITISDLELAPALTDDMVLPVENTTDTYAATLAMLRRLINKTFVGVNNADFNDLTDDGFYQCTGTPTNSPEAGAINWTLQVSAESGVVVQRAFSLDDGFENFYIRRFNGVMWTAWKNMTNVLGTPFSLGDSRYFEVAPYNTSWLASNGQYNSSFVYQSMWGQLQVELSNINVGEVGTYNGYSYTKRGLPVVLSTDTITDYDFVINTADETFRLPLKTKLASGSAVVGNGMTLGLTNGTYEKGLAYNNYGSSWYGLTPSGQQNNAVGTSVATETQGLGTAYGITTDPSKSGIETSSNGLKLYYYVGDTVQDASLINAGAILNEVAELKAHTIIETYKSGSNWYRVWSDGWVEQGGYVNSPVYNSVYTITLLIPYKDTNYTPSLTRMGWYNSDVWGSHTNYVNNLTASSFEVSTSSQGGGLGVLKWEAKGYIV